MPASSDAAGSSSCFSARPGWLALLVTGLLVPPLAFVACAFGMVILLAGLLGRAAMLVGRQVATAVG